MKKLLFLLLSISLFSVSCKKDPIIGDALFDYTVNVYKVSFENKSTLDGTYLWDFGDGETSSKENPVHAYPENTVGKYDVTLTVTDANDVKHSITKSIVLDTFIGAYIGYFREYTCSATPTVVSTIDNAKVEIIKKSNTKLNCVLKDNEENEIFSFSGKLDDENENKFKIPNFSYNSETLFGGGELIDGELKLNFASLACPVGGNTYRVTREFKEN